MDDVAGAVLAPDTLVRASAEGLDPPSMPDTTVTPSRRYRQHRPYRATLTNVNDFRAILIGSQNR
jgi:glycerate-2-kinase